MGIKISKKIFLGAVFFLFSFPFYLGAEENLVVLNSDQYINLEPGGARHFVLKVRNNSSQEAEVTARIVSINPSSRKEEDVPAKDKDAFLANDWLRILSEPRFSLSSQEEKEIPFLVSVPRDANQQGYYAGIYFEDKTRQIKSRLVLVALNVEKKGNKVPLRQGKLLDISYKPFVFYGPIDVRASFANFGKTHYLPRGQVDIHNVFNVKVASLPLSSPMSFPGGKVVLSAHWPQKFLLGKYLVVVKVFDGDNNSYVKIGTFWAFPWQEILIFIVVIILLVIARQLRIKRIKFE